MAATIDPRRLERLIRGVVRELELDLRGATVLTEAGTNAFVAAPLIAACAGAASVVALSRDTVDGQVVDIKARLFELARAMGVADNLCVETDRAAIPAGIDIITNAGFVRPIDAGLLALVSRPVVSYMREAWEWRDGDVDRAACAARGIPIAGQWEDFDGQNVFRSCGQLAIKMCFEAGLEVAGDRIAIVGTDRFAGVLGEALVNNLAHVDRVDTPALLTEPLVRELDAVVIADCTRSDVLLGAIGPRATQLAEWNPGLAVVQFAGANDVEALLAARLAVYPARRLRPQRMAFTLAHLGYRPCIYLLGQGLKVGELLWRRQRNGSGFGRFSSLVQMVAGGVPSG